MATAKPVSLFERAILVPAVTDSLRKLHPRLLMRNPVMFVVAAGSLLTTSLCLRDMIRSSTSAPLWFSVATSLWLWFTVLFANFAEAIAEGRGKAQAAALRKMRQETMA